VAASELDTRLVMRPLRNTERVLNNAAVERLLAKERRWAQLTFRTSSEVAGVYPRIMQNGDMDAGAFLRHGGRPDPRRAHRQGAGRPHHGRGRGLIRQRLAGMLSPRFLIESARLQPATNKRR
jgi:hypothetical protein